MNPLSVDVVLVEDDPDDAELVMRVLRKHSLVNQIIWLKDGAEALDFFCRGRAQDHPKVVLLDLKLPKINGIEVLQLFNVVQHVQAREAAVRVRRIGRYVCPARALDPAGWHGPAPVRSSAFTRVRIFRATFSERSG